VNDPPIGATIGSLYVQDGYVYAGSLDGAYLFEYIPSTGSWFEWRGPGYSVSA
jgi:hypothetical protein